MSSSTLKDRMKARRKSAREPMDIDTSPREELRTENAVDRFSGADDVDEEAEELEKKMKRRHKKTQRQLDRTLQSREDEAEDVNQQLRTAQGRTKQRVLEETARSAGEDSDGGGESSHVTRESENVAGDGTAPETTPPGTARSMGSQRREHLRTSTMAQSYRQKLVDKKNAAKEKAKDESYKESQLSGRLLTGMRSIARSTRFDDPDMSIQEEAVMEQLERSLSRQIWKHAAEKANDGRKTDDMPNEQESFDFFTKQFEPEPEPEKPEEEEEEEEDAEDADETAAEDVPRDGDGTAAAGQEGEGEEEATHMDAEEGEEGTSGKKKKKKKKKKGAEDEDPLLEDDLEEAEGWKYVHMTRAEYKPFRQRLKDEEDATFYPSYLEAPLQEKMFGREQPRYVEEEGFYVGVRPIVPDRNVYKMEQRLLMQGTEGSKKWFGEDGRLIALPDPLKEVSSRPFVSEEVAPTLQVYFEKPILQEFDSRFIDGSVAAHGLYQLDVDVNCVRLQHHHCFSREHVLAARLTDQYTQYSGRARRKTADYLTEKLLALQTAAAHVEENIATIKASKRQKKTGGLEDQTARLHEYRAEIRSTRRMRDGEMAADRTILKHIIQTWKDIKVLRTFQECVNTTAKLQIRKEPTNKAMDEEEWEREIVDQVKEMKEDLKEDHDKAMEKYRTDLDKWKKQKLDKKAAAKRQRQRQRNRQRRIQHRQSVEAGESAEEDEADFPLGGEDDDEEQEAADLRILEDLDVVEDKPEKPTFVEAAEARQLVVESFQEIRRRPGEPKLYPELSHGTAITNTANCPRGEQIRRNDVNRYRMFCRVLFNGKEVSRTQSKPMGQDFVVQFAQIFNIEIVQWPESIKIEIFETTGLSSTMLSELYLQIPDSNVTTDSNMLEDMEFSSEQRISHSHEGVGSDVAFSFEADGSNMLSLMTTGMLTTTVAWAIDAQGNVLVPPSASTGRQLYHAMKGIDAVAGIGMSGMSDMDKLTKWITESKLDPNDPSNADLMHLMRPAGGGDAMIQGLRLPEHFRLEQLQEEFNFCTDKDLEESIRFRFIKLREQEVPEFKNQVIPAFDHEMRRNTFVDYDKSMRSSLKLKGRDEMESHRIAVAKFMLKVREQISLRFRWANHQKTLSEMIDEDVLPDIGNFMPQLLRLLEPNRPLKPKRKERKKVPPQNLHGAGAVMVMVNVVRAFDIPVRTNGMAPPHSVGGVAGMGFMGQASLMTARGSRGGTDNGGSAGLWQAGMSARAHTPGANGVKNIAGEILVRPFIEVMFQRNTAQTSVADGPNPSWNEDLHIPFSPFGKLTWDESHEDLYSDRGSDSAPNGDYSTDSLENCNDMLYLNLFDEVIVDLPTDESDQDRCTNIHRRIEKKFLGSLKVPFSTIYLNSNIEGTFRIRKPPVLLGYTHEQSQHRSDGVTGMPELGAANTSSGDYTYVQLFITIEPPLALAETNKEKFDSNEDEKLLQMAEQWHNELKHRFPKRTFKCMVIDINATSVFLTRFLKPLKPPAELLEAASLQQQAEKVARFVSLIPFISDNVIFPGICDIWSTCDQFLQMLQGDEEEHAVMLANFFLYLGKPTWLLLGNAIPEGQTAYVLTKEENGEMRLWNPSTGEFFVQRDNYCPVTSIGCLANAENIWGNIQSNDQPSRMQFDLNNNKHWMPFFNKSRPHIALGSVQPEALRYKATDPQFVIELQERIEQKLKEKLMSWRPKHITRWNRYCMQAFRRLLVKLEDSHGSGAQEEHAAELEQVMGSYKLCGFPINLTYTEMTPLIDSVYATGVHNQEASDIEFALAVHIHPYPCNVLSVWIYVSSLVHKR